MSPCIEEFILYKSIIGHTNTSLMYLCNKVKYLDSTELLVTLQLDEIHIKLKISYCGQLYGHASNNSQQYSNIYDFICPIARQGCCVTCSYIYLYTITLEVIKNVVTACYRIVAIISNNNIINWKMFIELSGSDSLMPYIVNPVNKLN